MALDALVGTWKLVSYERCGPGVRGRYPFGRHPSGHLIYTADGWMAAAVMPERHPPSAPPAGDDADPFRARSWLSWRRLLRLARYVRAATRYISYSGRYTVVGDKIIVHVEVSQMPGLIQTDQERTFEFQGDRLVLTAETLGGRQQFVWARAAAESARGVVPSHRRAG